MPVSLSAIAAATATATVSLDGGSLNIVYIPNDITEKLIGQVSSGAVKATDFLAKIIKSWDLYQDDAQTALVATDADTLSNLGIPTLEVIMGAIVEDIRPNSSTAKTQS